MTSKIIFQEVGQLSDSPILFNTQNNGSADIMLLSAPSIVTSCLEPHNLTTKIDMKSH